MKEVEATADMVDVLYAFEQCSQAHQPHRTPGSPWYSAEAHIQHCVTPLFFIQAGTSTS